MNYAAWFGFDSLPVLEQDDPGRARLLLCRGNNSVAPYWLNQGADGWRLDVMGDGLVPRRLLEQFRTA